MTDFGLRDSYVAQMKGHLLTLGQSSLQLVDITHEIPPQDVRTGARILAEASVRFPPGTVHVAVVDPGVGTKRLILAAELAEQRFVLPDNGLLSYLLAAHRLGAVHAVDTQFAQQLNERSRFGGSSHTFHGRDIMAPVAAWLALGGAIEEVGPSVEELTKLPMLLPRKEGGAAFVPVESVDRFGNILTVADESFVRSWIEQNRLVLRISGRVVRVDLVKCYANRAIGDVVALFGSQGFLEIAMVNGSAAEALGVSSGDTVELLVDSDRRQS
jgi:S-adenosylmethionine hydrolase